MVTEESSVIAGASNAARCALPDGFFAESDEPVMVGQIQIVDAPKDAKRKIMEEKSRILKEANRQDPTLVKLGGGAMDLEARWISTRRGKQLVVHLLVDCRDAMGANAVNSMCERIGPLIERLSGGKVLLRIVSNLATRRMAYARARFSKKWVDVDSFLDAVAFAESDPYRACTHNKGIMNGIIAVALATGNDTRAIEAGAHAYASMNGYHPLTKWRKNKSGDLVGEIKLPLAVGIVGGAIRSNPSATIALKILGVGSAGELAQVLAAVGLAQNFAALRALTMEGIQKGHLRLHAKNVAISAGARGKEIETVASRMIREGGISVKRAKELLSSSSSFPS
jgi:hydroxymethylglutaryl-CoA reductase